MADPEAEFNNVTSLRAEALGEPGQRTFRILVDSGASSAVMWLEKEQLFQLALAMQRLLATLTGEQRAPRGQVEESAAPPPSQVEFKLGKLVLGHDRAREMFIIDAHDIESDDDAPPAVRVWGNISQIEAFAKEALRVCAGGRPICPLCGGPIDSTGHGCPRTNGHAPIDLINT
jgi:uncharacterized repeat protein (TIGR03847 family)